MYGEYCIGCSILNENILVPVMILWTICFCSGIFERLKNCESPPNVRKQFAAELFSTMFLHLLHIHTLLVHGPHGGRERTPERRSHRSLVYLLLIRRFHKVFAKLVSFGFDTESAALSFCQSVINLLADLAHIMEEAKQSLSVLWSVLANQLLKHVFRVRSRSVAAL